MNIKKPDIEIAPHKFFLQNIRKARNLRQEVLAREAEISQQALSNYETERREPSFEILKKLAQILKVEISDFFKETDFRRFNDPSFPEKLLSSLGDHERVCGSKEATLLKLFRKLEPERQDDLINNLVAIIDRDRQ